ncbi:MAG: hypothetical protein KKH28_08010 [Elusimicrobia bacterium]|nr:hypothetical protein [Elusimicrobiota bacterium]
MKTTIALCLLFFCARAYAAGLFPSRPFSDEAAGAVSAVFLKTPPAARFEALANAGAALRTPEAFFYNPAGTAFLGSGRSALLLGYESLLESSGRTSLAVLKGLESGTFGLGALYRYEAGLEKYDALGAAGGGFQAYDAAVIGSYARRFDLLDFGFALKFIRSRLYDRAANSAALDVGAVFKGGGGSATELALAARNLGFPMKMGARADPLPFELSGAMHWRYAPGFSILAEGKLPVDHSPYVILAGEYGFALKNSSGLFLRAGFNFKNYDSLGLMGAFASGFGLKFDGWGFDYAFVPYGDLGSTHRVTLGRGFGSAQERPAPAPAMPVNGPAVVQAEVVKITGGTNVAVADFIGKNVSQADASIVADFLRTELVNTGSFNVMDRNNMDTVLAEQKFQSSGCTEQQCAVEMGKLLNVKQMFVGSLSKLLDTYYITVNVVDVETGKITASYDSNASSSIELRDACKKIVKKLSRK